jgi:hypothetical protein
MSRFFCILLVLFIKSRSSAQLPNEQQEQLPDGGQRINLKYAHCRIVGPFVDAMFNGNPDADKRPGGMRLERVRVVVDTDTNALIIWADQQDCRLARQFINELDKDVYSLHDVGVFQGLGGAAMGGFQGNPGGGAMGGFRGPGGGFNGPRLRIEPVLKLRHHGGIAEGVRNLQVIVSGLTLKDDFLRHLRLFRGYK